MIKLLSACSCCGHIFGRAADGTRTELRCPKCGAEMEYCVTGRYCNGAGAEAVGKAEGKKVVSNKL